MSFMGENDDNEMSDAEAEQIEAMRASLDAVRFRYEESGLEEILRKLGVYVQDVAIMPVPDMHTGGVKPMLALRTKVNRSAFTDRVIDPEKAAMDRQFDAMTIAAEGDIFLDKREQIQRNIAEGRDWFDDGDGDSESGEVDG